MAKCYTFFFHLLTYEKNRNKCPFCDIFDKKGKNEGLNVVLAAIFGGNICPQVRVIDTEKVCHPTWHTLT